MQPDENASAAPPAAPDGADSSEAVAQSAPLTPAAAPPPPSVMGDPETVQPSAPLADESVVQPSAPLAGAPLPPAEEQATGVEAPADRRRRGGLRALACLVVAGFFALLVVTQDRGAGLEVLWGFLAVVWTAMAGLALVHARRAPGPPPGLDGIEDDDLAG